jgi:hypothetical protein
VGLEIDAMYPEAGRPNNQQPYLCKASPNPIKLLRHGAAGPRAQASETGHLPDPPTVCTAVSNWRVGDVIPLPRGRDLRVVATVAGATEDEDAVLVVEPA